MGEKPYIGKTRPSGKSYYGGPFNVLPRGRYELRVQKAGLSDQTANVTLTVGDTITANFAQTPGPVEQVEVTSLPTEVDSSTSQIKQPVSQVQIASLPTNDRNFQQLANFIAGTATAERVVQTFVPMNWPEYPHVTDLRSTSCFTQP
jgi:hypothetical protein